MKLTIPAVAAALAAAASPGLAADADGFADMVTLAEFQRSIAPNRLDLYDGRRELAREAEHRRIRTRLGDPGCQTVAVDNRYGYGSQPALVVVVCR